MMGLRARLAGASIVMVAVLSAATTFAQEAAVCAQPCGNQGASDWAAPAMPAQPHLPPDAER